MTHQRKKIRDEIRSRLRSTTSAGENVYFNRTKAFFDDSVYPAIVIRTISDTASRDSVSPPTYKRNLTLSIDIYTTRNEDIDDELDRLAEEVEGVMAWASHDFLTPANETEELVEEVMLGSTDVVLHQDGDSYYAVASVQIICVYYQEFTKTNDELVDFATAAIEYNQEGNQASAETANDLLTGLDK